MLLFFFQNKIKSLVKEFKIISIVCENAPFILVGHQFESPTSDVPFHKDMFMLFSYICSDCAAHSDQTTTLQATQ